MRGKKVPVWVLLQEATLLAGRRLAQQRDASVPMMIVHVVPEELLPDLERQVLDTSALRVCLRERLAQSNQSLSPPGNVG